jgi:hypothetical protein
MITLWILLMLTAVCFVGGIVGLLYVAPDIKKRLFPPETQVRRVQGNWGELPVVKITGDEEEGRYVETRRIMYTDGDKALEVRLLINGVVVESRRMTKYDEATAYHDSLVARNGLNPNAGAAPAWHAVGRVRVLEAGGMSSEEAIEQARKDLEPPVVRVDDHLKQIPPRIQIEDGRRDRDRGGTPYD